MLDDPLLRLLVSAVLGGAIGWERFTDRKPAGLRTHTIVCLGSTAFMIAGESLMLYPGSATPDLTRVMQGVITGVGFLGAGSILQAGGSIRGLTSAATVWLVAAIGVLVGVGDTKTATLLTLLALVVLRGFRWIENAWRRAHPAPPHQHHHAKDDAKKAAPPPGPPMP